MVSACTTYKTPGETLSKWYPNQELHQSLSTEALQTEAENGSTEAEIQFAIRLMNGDRIKRDQTRAYSMVKELAEAGDARAQYMLGTAYILGAGVEADETEGVEWFRKSAKGGYDVGQYWYAYKLSRGQGVPEADWEAALPWFQRAARQGHVNAQFSLGEIHESCRAGFDRDFEKAAFWYRKADGVEDSMPARINLRRLIDLGLIEWQPGDPGAAPTTLQPLESANFTVCEDGARDPLLD